MMMGKHNLIKSCDLNSFRPLINAPVIKHEKPGLWSNRKLINYFHQDSEQQNLI